MVNHLWTLPPELQELVDNFEEQSDKKIKITGEEIGDAVSDVIMKYKEPHWTGWIRRHKKNTEIYKKELNKE